MNLEYKKSLRHFHLHKIRSENIFGENNERKKKEGNDFIWKIENFSHFESKEIVVGIKVCK